MLADEIRLGNRIEITKKSNEALKTYISVVEDNFGGNRLRVYVPISYGSLIRLNMLDVYSMLFFTEKGMYKFDARITEYITENGFAFMDIELLSDGEKIQRRSFFRFECMIGFKFEKITEENVGDMKIDVYEKSVILDEGIIKDLSAGGIRFISNVELTEKDKIKILIILEEGYVVCTGEIIGKQKFSKSEYHYQYRVRFTDIKDSDKDLIIRYIFKSQRKLAKKKSGL